MNEERGTGVILRTRPLTESSLIVEWLTESHGRLSSVAKGARRPKSTFSGKLDLYHQADWVLTRSRRGDLHTLREVQVLDRHQGLRRDLRSLQRAAYATLLIERNIERETSVPELYHLVIQFLGLLSSQPDSPLSVILFEWQFLEFLGLAPDLGQRPWREAAGELGPLLAASAPRLLIADPSAPATRRLVDFLGRLLAGHLSAAPEARRTALAVS